MDRDLKKRAEQALITIALSMAALIAGVSLLVTVLR